MNKLDIPYRSFRTQKGIIHLFYNPTDRRPQQCSNWTFALLKFLKRPSSFSESIANNHSLIKKSKITHRVRHFLTQPTNKEVKKGTKKRIPNIFRKIPVPRSCPNNLQVDENWFASFKNSDSWREIFASLLLAGAGLCSIVTTETTKWSPLSNSIQRQKTNNNSTKKKGRKWRFCKKKKTHNCKLFCHLE